MIDPKALDAALDRVLAGVAALLRQVLADVPALLREGDVVAIDGKALSGARDAGESERTRMMVSACAARLRLTLANRPADRDAELEAALVVHDLIALKGNAVSRRNW